jgi:hypothetical protein
MNILTLNGPLEVGLRQLTLLNSAFPRALDLATLAALDHAVLHSADFGGPASLHPGVPHYRAEQAVKRELIEHGLQVMIRAGLINVRVSADGILYAASERAISFLKLLEASYVRDLKERADWVVSRYADDDQSAAQDEDGQRRTQDGVDAEDPTP